MILRLLSQIKLFFYLARSWRQAQKFAALHHHENRSTHRVLLVPCDPWSVMGSRGDQAMILAIQQQVKEQDSSSSIDVVCENHDLDQELSAKGLRPLVKWNSTWLKKDFQYLDQYDAVYILGADVTDGVYSWSTAMMLLMYYDIAERLGLKAHYMGFSFSSRAATVLKLVFPCLKKGLILPVRDPVSLKRLQKFTLRRPLDLVADVAFCLKPRATSRMTNDIEWCDKRRNSNSFVLGVNIHPMFNSDITRTDCWKDAAVKLLETLLTSEPSLHLILIPHDNRKNVSDLFLLKEIYDNLGTPFKSRVAMIAEVLDADELKELVGHVDALIAGRMHLSIAALGRGVPVLGMVYQDKFEGLWQHVGLPQALTLAKPEEILIAPKQLQEKIIDFVARNKEYRQILQQRLPAVKALSFKNFQQKSEAQ